MNSKERVQAIAKALREAEQDRQTGDALLTVNNLTIRYKQAGISEKRAGEMACTWVQKNMLQAA